MKIKQLFKKAAAMVMAAVTVLSGLPATTAFAATGDVGTISFTGAFLLSFLMTGRVTSTA